MYELCLFNCCAQLKLNMPQHGFDLQNFYFKRNTPKIIDY